MPVSALHPLRLLHYGRDGVGAVQTVPCIEEDDVFARGSKQCLVHRIVEPAVGFADEPYVVARLVLLDVALHEREGVVGGAAVDDEVLYAGVVLRGNTCECTPQGRFGIIRDGRYGDKWLHTI